MHKFYPTTGRAAALVLVLVITCLMPICTLNGQPTEDDIKEWKDIWNNQDGIVPDSTLFSTGQKLGEHYIDYSPDMLLPLGREMDQRGIQKDRPAWRAYSRKITAEYYRKSGKLDSAIIFYHTALSYLKEDSLTEISKIYGLLGITHSQMRQVDSAAYYLKKCIERGEKYKKNNIIRFGAMNLGVSYGTSGKYVEALDYFFKALDAAETPSQRYLCHYNLGITFRTIRLWEEAKLNFKQAYENAMKAGSLNDILYSQLALLQLPTNLDTMQVQLEQALRIADSLHQKNTKALILTAAGSLYLDSMQTELAKKYVRQASEIAVLANNQRVENIAQLMQAKIKNMENEPVASLDICHKALPYFEANRDSSHLRRIYELLYSNFKTIGKADSALYYLEKKVAVTDALENQTVAKTAIGKYLEYKKQQEINVLTQQKELAEQAARQSMLRQRQSYLLLALFGLFFLSVTTIYILLYKQKQKRTSLLEQMNAALEAEKAKLDLMNHKLRRFSNIVSHDILSSLDLMLSTGNILAAPKTPTRNLTRYYEMTQSTTRQLKNYCLNLLQEAKESGIRHNKLTNPKPILQKVLLRYDSQLKAANFNVQRSALSAVRLSEVLIEQVFQNLISNALRYAATNETPQLWITERKTDQQQTQWIVEDNGPGIPPHQRDTIFQATGPESSRHGQHMGLHLLKSSLKEAGANIWVEERPGGGARFIVDIP